jgi:hypothetical protein
MIPASVGTANFGVPIKTIRNYPGLMLGFARARVMKADTASNFESRLCNKICFCLDIRTGPTRGLTRNFACSILRFGLFNAREATGSKIVPNLWYTEKAFMRCVESRMESRLALGARAVRRMSAYCRSLRAMASDEETAAI